MPHESLDKVALLRPIEPKELSRVGAPLPMAARQGQGMADRARRRRHRHLFPDQRRRARADHAVTRPRGDSRRHQRRWLFRRDGRDRRAAPLGRHPGHYRRHNRGRCRPPCSATCLRGHPDISEQLLKQLVGRIRTLDQRINEFSSMDVKHRIYAELLRRSRPDPNDERQALVSPPPVHSDIAARVSTRREMVARELKALERAGLLVKRRGAFVITNVPEMVRMVQSD